MPIARSGPRPGRPLKATERVTIMSGLLSWIPPWRELAPTRLVKDQSRRVFWLPAPERPCAPARIRSTAVGHNSR